MHFFEITRDPAGDGLQRALGRLFSGLGHSLFGGGTIAGGPVRQAAFRDSRDRCVSDDDIGWLSLTSDADGHSVFEEDVICMGVTPDDLDIHDADGGDLSWIGLSPVHPPGRSGSR